MVRSTAYPEATDAHVTPWGLARPKGFTCAKQFTRPKGLTRSSAALPVRSTLNRCAAALNAEGNDRAKHLKGGRGVEEKRVSSIIQSHNK